MKVGWLCWARGGVGGLRVEQRGWGNPESGNVIKMNFIYSFVDRLLSKFIISAAQGIVTSTLEDSDK